MKNSNNIMSYENSFDLADPWRALEGSSKFPRAPLRNTDLAQGTVLRIRDAQPHEIVDTLNLKVSERQTCAQMLAMQVGAGGVHGRRRSPSVRSSHSLCWGKGEREEATKKKPVEHGWMREAKPIV